MLHNGRIVCQPISIVLTVIVAVLHQNHLLSVVALCYVTTSVVILVTADENELLVYLKLRSDKLCCKFTVCGNQTADTAIFKGERGYWLNPLRNVEKNPHYNRFHRTKQ